MGDATAIWFAQLVGPEIHVIDYYEASGQGIDHYAKAVRDRPYVYAAHLAPHDARAREWGSGRTREEHPRVAAQLYASYAHGLEVRSPFLDPAVVPTVGQAPHARNP